MQRTHFTAVILCIIVYVANKAHLSLIIIIIIITSGVPICLSEINE